MAEDGSGRAAYDINGSDFKPSAYLEKLIKDKTLSELLDHENDIVQQIKHLDSEMQTLVYENYNKFIDATDTIRKMKTDFHRMEQEMSELSEEMTSLTEFSGRISSTLHDRRSRISQLAGVHSLLKKLQFLFELPTKLRQCIEAEAYSQAVRYYVRTQSVLRQYQDLPSFGGIQADCQQCVAQLKEKLRLLFKDQESSAKQLAQSVELLLQLGEPADALAGEFLLHSRERLDAELASLARFLSDDVPAPDMTSPPTSPSSASSSSRDLPLPSGRPDVLEFVDRGCNGFLSSICLVIAAFNDMFLSSASRRPYNPEEEEREQELLRRLVQFVHSLMQQYFSLVEKRVQMEKDSGDNTLLVRALDRFHRRLQAMHKLLPDIDFSRAGTEIVSKAASERACHYLAALKRRFADCMTDIRQSLASSRSDATGADLHQLLSQTQHALLEQTSAVLDNLQAFIASDITFAMKPHFRFPFCTRDVREGVVVAFIQHVNTLCREFCEETGEKSSAPPTLILILSRLCVDFQTSTIGHLMTLCNDQFEGERQQGSDVTLTSELELCEKTKVTAEMLINHYVRLQGLAISQMLRKSVETRDCLNTIEPRSVRAVMKRVVEDLTAMDTQVGQLLEEGTRKERSSDSSRRTGLTGHSRPRGQWQFSGAPGSVDASMMSNIHRLFAEKIEVFAAVEFNKVSVLTGVIKIALKTLLECVRLKTFGRFGLQQVQVDAYYLQLYLWRFVADENLVHVMLDEILTSAMNRCVSPALMETSVIELICERT